MRVFNNAKSGLFLLICLFMVQVAGRVGAQGAGKAQVPGAGAAPYVPGQVLVKFRPGTAAASIQAANDQVGGQTIQSFGGIGWRLVKLPQGMNVNQGVAAYDNLGNVAQVEPNYIYYPTALPNDPAIGQLYGMTKIGAPSAWDFTTGSQNVVIAVCDTGVNYNHEDLAANMFRNTSEIPGNNIDDDLNGFVDDVYGMDGLNNDSDPMDDNNHGTHCAGTIGAVGNNAIGVAGVNWNVRIMALKFLPAQGGGPTSAAIACIQYATMMKRRGVPIAGINHSWGGGGASQALQDALNAAGDAGILNLCAAGNGGDDGVGDNNDTTPFYPSSYNLPSIIAVAASDQQDAAADFSNFGAKSVHLSAPGVGIVSSLALDGSGQVSNNSYAPFNGTSMATPHVAGAVGLLSSLSSRLTAAELKSMLLSSVDVLPQWSGKVSTGGRLNVFRAMQPLLERVPPTISITSPGQGAILNAWPVIAGTAADNPGGTGVGQVTVSILRNSDSLYWNGATWVGSPTPLPALLNPDGTWVFNGIPPSGTNLSDGGYTISASATDRAGNSTTAAVGILLDTGMPIVTITSPLNNTFTYEISSATGTAADNAGGTGLTAVNVVIRRDADNHWWTGSTWSPTVTPLATSLNANGTWTIRSDVPMPGNLLRDGTYTIGAVATDRAGNVGTALVKQTVISGLGITFINPLNGGALADFSRITGRAAEAPSASGITTVFVTIQRKSDNLYWNGLTWQTVPSGMPTTLNADGTWAIRSDSGLPTGSNLIVGDYNINAIVVDRAGNVANSLISVTLDPTPPTVSITTPVNNLVVRSIPSIRGSASDNGGGSGITRVELSIMRFDGVSWNGTFWTESASGIQAQRSTNSWSVDGLNKELPSGDDLVDGRYTLQVTAYDKAGNSTSASRTITVDNTAPNEATVITPLSGALVSRFTSITGRASDKANGTGVKSVGLTIQRASDSKWWTGSSWSPSKRVLTTVLSGSGLSWTRNANLPAGQNLLDDLYTVSTITTDKAGNMTEGTSMSVTIDRSAPTLTFTNPALNATVKTLAEVRGTVEDNDNGSGVSSVNLYIQRKSDSKWWIGSAWSSRKTALTTTISGNSWFRRSALPTGSSLTDGVYTLIAQVTDRINNKQEVTSVITLDRTAPEQVTILTPTKNANINAFSSITGVASDGRGGSGLDRVELTIQRGNQWWTGRTWSATKTILATRLTGTSWRANVALPGGALLQAGSYMLTATAFDRAGLSLSTTNAITVGRVTTASQVRLSVAAASAAQNSVQLRFGGSLDSETASDAANYTVLVNGRAVVVESAGYNASNRSVVLALPEGSLHAGDRVVIQWNGVSDAQGNTLNGQVGPLNVG